MAISTEGAESKPAVWSNRSVRLLFLLAAMSAHAQTPLIVIGLDGFRSDYAIRHSAPRIAGFVKQGASAASLVPSFPSTTFPNFYTIATGLPPARHGIVEMDFHDPSGKRFYYRDAAAVADPAWYGGTPIWLAAERAGIKAATYFWPGSSVAIRGRKPSWSFVYDPKVTRDDKVRQTLAWLDLPPKERPGLVMLYFSDVDAAGHAHGPLAPQTKEAVAAVDRSAGDILDGLAKRKIAANVVFVSDHGMSAVQQSIDLTPLADFSGFRISNGLGLVQLYSSDIALIDKTYAALRGKSPMWTVYRRAEIPAHLQFSDNPRIGDLVILPNGPYMIAIKYEIPPLRGMHGYDPKRFREMDGILYAAGPAFRPGAYCGPVLNTTLYAMFARLLGLKNAPPPDPSWKGLLR